jgi:hypothetical protein
MTTPAGLMTNMNFPAPLSVLGFLAGCVLLALSALAIVVASFIGRFKLVRLLLACVGAGSFIYLALLACVSLASHDRTLARGQEKYFCEIDCHLAYSLVGVTALSAANRTDYTITLRTRFDETTISARRPKDRPLTPNPREIRIVDTPGQLHTASLVGGTPLVAPLKPGDSYFTQLRCSLPPDVRPLRLLLTSQGWPEHLLIGDELSPLHGKTWFAL